MRHNEALNMTANGPILESRERKKVQIFRPSSSPKDRAMSTEDELDCGGANGHVCPAHVEKLWSKARKHHYEEMKRVRNVYRSAVRNVTPRCSILDGFRSRSGTTRTILEALKGESMDNFTPKMDSVFLHYFERKMREVDSQTGAFEPLYLRLGKIENESKDEGYRADHHDVERLFRCEKALQLQLLCCSLLGFAPGEVLKSYKATLDKANDETFTISNLFFDTQDYFNSLFDLTKTLKLGLEVKLDKVCISKIVGVPDLSLTVNRRSKAPGAKKFKQCVLLCEFKKPNAGFWIPWTLLTGKTWTDEEKSAFFILRDLSADEDMAENFQNWDWENYNPAIWDAAMKVIDQVGSEHVDVKYHSKLPTVPEEPENEPPPGEGPSERPNTEAAKTPVQTSLSGRKRGSSKTNAASKEGAAKAKKASNKGVARYKDPVEEVRSTLSGLTTASGKGENENWPSSYFISGNSEMSSEFTKLLSDAEFLTNFNSCFKNWAQITRYALLAPCSSLLIADGLTMLAGSLHKVEVTKKGDSNPTNSEDVWDLHFYKTYMMQTHDQDSILDLMNYLCNRVYSVPDYTMIVDQLLTFAEKFKGRIDKHTQTELKKLMRDHNFEFNGQDSDSKNPDLQRGRELLNKRARAVIVQALVEFDKSCSELRMNAEHMSSDAFIICEWFRESIWEGVGSDEPFRGRSISVAKVQRRDDDSQKYYVLKEYHGDEDSVSRMERELEAYRRVAKLPRSQWRRHVAELVSFGSLDLDDGDSRLFLLLEYVEEPEMVSSMDSTAIKTEVAKVDILLQSVGVCHNDLDKRNYKWQHHEDGWSIKVFDFDHASFFSLPFSIPDH